MKQISEHTAEVWESGNYVGTDRRPMMRATIQKLHIGIADYNLRATETRTWDHKGHYAHALFGVDQKPRELFNIKSVSWSRNVDSDVAECTITLYNVQKLPELTEPDNDEDFDRPGWYTPNRGDDSFFGSRWGYDRNKWFGWIAPDRLIRTYEGYGTDLDAVPEDDEYMYPSGVWIVDSVELTAEGLITVKCRDLGRLLLDHIVMPPVVPRGAYPLWWEKKEEVGNPPQWELAGTVHPTHTANSNEFFIDVDDLHPDQEVDGDGEVRGHAGADAFDSDADTFWLSNGNRARDFAWVQGSMTSTNVEGVKLNMKGGPYRVFVSLWDNAAGKWLGRSKIPYDGSDDPVDIEARINYVEEFTTNKAGEPDAYGFRRLYENVSKVRFTFTRLWKSDLGTKYPNRAAVQEAAVATNALLEEGTGTRIKGNYSDYTDIVKWFCSWAGFWWPPEGSGRAWVRHVDGSKNFLAPASEDDALARGAVWGDFMQTGTTGFAKLPVETFDKRPLMDGINAVREIIGFDFWIDETGAVVWRLPNIFKKGSYLQPTLGGVRSTRTTDVVVLDEATSITSLSVTMSSANVRERVFVANVGGNFGWTVKGFNPYPSRMRRVGGWTDQNFENQRECRRMAEMIALRQAVTYRQGSITIAANPAIQIDDQVRIYERVTGEGYLHRVTGISCDFDNEQGIWTYQLSTHWMGDEPFTKWAFADVDLSETTKEWLIEMGAIDEED